MKNSSLVLEALAVMRDKPAAEMTEYTEHEAYVLSAGFPEPPTYDDLLYAGCDLVEPEVDFAVSFNL